MSPAESQGIALDAHNLTWKPINTPLDNLHPHEISILEDADHSEGVWVVYREDNGTPHGPNQVSIDLF